MPAWERYFDLSHPKSRYLRLRFDWFLNKVYGKKFLDVGCEGGLGIYLAAQKSAIEVLCGLDINEKEVRLARVRLKDFTKLKNISLVVGSAEELPWKDNFFDCVMCGEMLEHVMDDKKVISEIYRVMKFEGTLLLSVPDNGHISKRHLRLYSKQSIENLVINSGFFITESNRIHESDKGFWLLIRGIKR